MLALVWLERHCFGWEEGIFLRKHWSPSGKIVFVFRFCEICFKILQFLPLGPFKGNIGIL